MKNKYLFSSKMKAFNKRWLCIASLLLAGLLNATLAYADLDLAKVNIQTVDMTFQSGKVIYQPIEFTKSGYTTVLFKDKTSLNLKRVKIKAWQNEPQSNLCSAHMCYMIGENGTVHDIEIPATSWGNTGGIREPIFSGDLSIELIENYKPNQDFYVYFWFYLTGDNSKGTNCSQKNYYNNNSQNYAIQVKTPVQTYSDIFFLGDEPSFASDGKLQLSAYLKRSNCISYQEYGVIVGTDPNFADKTFKTYTTDKSSAPITSANQKSLIYQSIPRNEITPDTKYYYKFFLNQYKGGSGVQEWTSVGEFTIPQTQTINAIKLTKSGATPTYLYLTKRDATHQDVKGVIPCTGTYTYQFVYQTVGTTTWTPLGEVYNLNSEYNGHEILFTANVEAAPNVTVSTSVVSNNFNFFNWDVEFTQKAPELNIHIDGNGNKSYFVGTGGVTNLIPTGTKYTIYRTLQGTQNKCTYAAQQAVPSQFTNKNSQKDLIAVNYKSGDTKVNFALQRAVWTKKKDDHFGEMPGTQQAANTMVPIACVTGNQGSFKADYALVFDTDVYPDTRRWENLGVNIMEGETMTCYTSDWWYKNGHNQPIHVRYLYNSADKKAYVHPYDHANGFKLRLTKTGGETKDFIMLRQGQSYTYQVEVADLTGYQTALVIATNPDANQELKIWSDTPVELQYNKGKAIFTYDFQANCLQGQYLSAKDLALKCAEDGLQVTKDGQISVTVHNVGGVAFKENTYSLQVNLIQPEGKIAKETKVVMSGSYKALEPGASAIFKSAVGAITSLNDYSLSATIYSKDDVNPDNNYCSKEVCSTDISAATLNYYIDSQFLIDSDCRLQYRSLETAIQRMKANPGIYDPATKLLKKDVIMNVAKADQPYTGTYDPKKFNGGEVEGVQAILIDDINNNGETGVTPAKTLTIKAADAKARPTLGHVIIRRSKNVTLDGLMIQGDPEIMDNALDIDFKSADVVDPTTGAPLEPDWLNKLTPGQWKNANINIVNSYITSYGFTCIHVVGVQGITMENNDIEAHLANDNDNTANWGASAKFLRVGKLKFVRNNFRGAHATSMFLQEPLQALVMNNVFWNTNLSRADKNGVNKTAFIRLVSQINSDQVTTYDCSKVGIYYNTLYLADSQNEHHVDFVRCGGEQKGSNGKNQQSFQGAKAGVEFLYNNCYSYDLRTPGKNADPSSLITAQHNNFWSMYSAQDPNQPSVFAFGTDPKQINVESQVCTTASTDPASLVVRGAELNIGNKINTDASEMGAQNIKNDRTHETAVRPTGGTGWTYGAYQTVTGQVVNEIIWNGSIDGDWDNRGNWVKLVEGKAQKLTCVDILGENLKVIIPAPNSKQYPVPAEGIQNYPQLPVGFDAGQRRIKRFGEQVDANMSSVPTKFAQSIELENGASIRGIEALQEHYGTAITHFNADREDWILVGTVVKPFASGNAGATRNLKSADFFLGHEPHVYMHQSRVQGAEVVWDAPFTDLETEVKPTDVFAIQIPDQYGPYKLPADFYYSRFSPNPDKVNDGTKKMTYTFQGKFANDAALPSYTGTAGQPSLVCNTYPANINLDALSKKGTIYYYDYQKGSFVVWAANLMNLGEASIKSQNGFVFIPNASGPFVVEPQMFDETSTEYRSVEAVQPYVIIEAAKKVSADVAPSSVVNISYNELKEDNYNAETDKQALLASTNVQVPLVYIMEYGKKLQTLEVAKQTKIIPLGLQLGENMTFTFDATQVSDYDEVILEDRTTGHTYDLTQFKAEFTLDKGVYEGRFFLNLKGQGEGVVDPEVPTDIEQTESDAAADSNAITILAHERTITVSSSENVELQQMFVTDMAGRTVDVPVSGHYAVFELTANPGVYVVHVIGNTQSKSEKVIIK